MDGTSSYTYDLDDEVTAVTDPNGFAATYAYDGLGRLAGESEPEQYGYYTEEVPVATYIYDGY